MAYDRIISADSHSEEPDELYDRLSPELRARRPHTEVINGRRYSIAEGRAPTPLELPGELTEEDKRREFRAGGDVGFGTNRAGGIDIPLRLADQEEDGISAEIIYPQGFMRTVFSPDPEYQNAFARLYNDFYAEVFFSYADRFVPSAAIPLADINAAVEEARRVAKLGYRSLSIPVSRPPLPYDRADYEPFWEAVVELGIPMSLHVFTKSESTKDDEPTDTGEDNGSRGEIISGMVLGMAEAMSPLTMLVGSGALEHHPNLKFVLVECGIGWLAWVLQTMDTVAERQHMWMEPRLPMRPSEYFKRQGYITFQDDEVGLHNRVFTGVDSLMWGSDYPHDEGTFPHSQEVIEKTFKDIPEEDKRKIVYENAAKLYGFPLN